MLAYINVSSKINLGVLANCSILLLAVSVKKIKFLIIRPGRRDGFVMYFIFIISGEPPGIKGQGR